MAHAIEVSDAGIRIGAGDEPVDVAFDGHRVWSFQPSRDGRRAPGGLQVAWPAVLVPHLKGTARVRLSTGATSLFDAEVAFAGSAEPLQLRDGGGQFLTVDKGGRLQRTFADTDDSTKRMLVETVNQVLADLREHTGLEAFLSFGCLLGAVRAQKMIGHDADADVTLLSEHTHPYDIARDLRRAERTMRRLGYQLARMSGADFKIWAKMPDGNRVGIDVFGAYWFDGLLHLLPNTRGELAREALLPVGSVMLEGVEVIAPAQPERLLELLYGPSWRVPDPSFKYTHPRDVSRHMGGYWQGTRRGKREWTEFYRYAGAQRVPSTPSDFAQWSAERIEPGDQLLDVGYGTGRDAVWFAGRGHQVDALEFTSAARKKAARLARQQLGPRPEKIRFVSLNLNDLDAVLIQGARYAHDGVVRHLYARFLIDSLPQQSRLDLWRFASMVQRRGGLTFVEFRTQQNRGTELTFERSRRRFFNPDAVVAEIEERGGRVVERVEGRGLARFENEDPHVCRLVVRWDR